MNTSIVEEETSGMNECEKYSQRNLISNALCQILSS